MNSISTRTLAALAILRILLVASPALAQDAAGAVWEPTLLAQAFAGLIFSIAHLTTQLTAMLVEGRGGVAADWPPMRNDAHRQEVAAFTTALPQCGGGAEG